MTDNMDTQRFDDASFTSRYEEEEGMQQLDQELRQFQITGLDALPRIRSEAASSDSWDVESYAADSMKLTKMRLAHLRLGYEDLGYGYDDDDYSYGTSSLGDGSAAPRRGRSQFVIEDEDDWTVQSDCNDSIGLAKEHLGMSSRNNKAEQPQPKVAKQPLARITRRRASMDNFVHQQEHQQQQQQQQWSPPRVARPTVVRHMSMSSVSVATAEESLSSHASGSSNDPAGGGRRGSMVRHKSMPYVKRAPLASAVPLWPAGNGTPRQKMARRVSNNGTPCAA